MKLVVTVVSIPAWGGVTMTIVCERRGHLDSISRALSELLDKIHPDWPVDFLVMFGL